MVGGSWAKITGKLVGEAAQQGDQLALDVVSHAGAMLGLGIVNLLHLFNPEMVIIGGSVTELGDLLLAPMHDMIEKHVMAEEYLRELIITAPKLGDDVSLYGAAVLVLTQGGVANIDKVIAQLDAK